METKTRPQPEIGMGATLCYPRDSYGFVITRVGKTFIEVRRLTTVDKTTGHEPAYFEGPFPVWSHTYTEDERRDMAQGEPMKAHLRKDGRFYLHGTPMSVGQARLHLNYSY